MIAKAWRRTGDSESMIWNNADNKAWYNKPWPVRIMLTFLYTMMLHMQNI